MTDDDFPFTLGETVLVRVREHGTSGRVVARFEAKCTGFERLAGPGPGCARLDLPFGTLNSVTIAPHEGEFEVVDDAE